MKYLKKDRVALVCSIILILIIISIIFAPYLTPYKPNTQMISEKLLSVNSKHLLGTDELGRDILSRLLYGGRITLLLGFLLTLIISMLGLVLGILSNICGKTVKTIIDFFCNLFLTLPSEMLSLTIIAIVGPSIFGLVLAITLTRWPWYVKMISNEIEIVMSKDYCTFSKVSGKSIFWILKHHVWQNIKASFIVYTTIDLGGLIMSIASLSFLGIGVQPPMAEWGRMLNDAKEVAMVAPWQMIPSGVMIFVVTAILNYLGDFISDVENNTKKVGYTDEISR